MADFGAQRLGQPPYFSQQKYGGCPYIFPTFFNLDSILKKQLSYICAEAQQIDLEFYTLCNVQQLKCLGASLEMALII